MKGAPATSGLPDGGSAPGPKPAAQLAFWQQVGKHRLGRWLLAQARALLRWLTAVKLPTPTTAQCLKRVMLMERDITLPIKAIGVPILMYLFYHGQWIDNVAKALDVEVDFSSSHYFLWLYIGFFWFYAVFNLAAAGVLLAMKRLPPGLVLWTAYASALVDGILLSTIVLVTGGFNSIIYYLFLGLIVRSAVGVARPSSQIALNITLTFCFLFAGFIDVLVAGTLPDEVSRSNMMLSEGYPTESVVLRLSLLLLLTVCSYGAQVVLEYQRRTEEENRELAVREGQLRSAGRLAAEFAHQIKNPLAIINTAVFSLKRALRTNNAAIIAEQIAMIEEEIGHSDRIITEIMGYAELSEGHLERLDLLEELDSALKQVFPPAAHYPVRVHRACPGPFPPLLMQRRHLADTFANLLQNAREAMGSGGGNIFIKAACLEDSAVEISIADDGPGIPRDKHERVFQAYYTTKSKGTGVGLATVKHNVELYGGSVRLESELGKGARFILLFPVRTLNAPGQST
jgi:signal transduction histidine kinase